MYAHVQRHKTIASKIGRCHAEIKRLLSRRRGRKIRSRSSVIGIVVKNVKRHIQKTRLPLIAAVGPSQKTSTGPRGRRTTRIIVQHARERRRLRAGGRACVCGFEGGRARGCVARSLGCGPRWRGEGATLRADHGADAALGSTLGYPQSNIYIEYPGCGKEQLNGPTRLALDRL